MKKLRNLLLACVASVWACAAWAQAELPSAGNAVIPQPSSVQSVGGTTTLKRGAKIGVAARAVIKCIEVHFEFTGNTTVNTSVSSSADSKSGIYLQVNGYEIDHHEVLLYRGITDIAKKQNVMPHRKWRLECNKNLFPKFDHVMDIAKYPLENSYYFTDMFTLPGMSEQAALLMLPVTGSDGTVYGICGFEMSESFFKQYYRQDTKLSHMTGLMTSGTAKDSISDYFVCGSSDNYYYSPQGELEIKDFGKGLSLFNSESESFTGVIRSSDSDSAGNTFTTVVMVPKTDYDKSAWGSTLHMLLILLLLTCFAVIGCLLKRARKSLVATRRRNRHERSRRNSTRNE